MDEHSSKKRDVPRADDGDPSAENERPTINPPFDIEAFARANASSPSDTGTTRPPPAVVAPSDEVRSDSRPSTKLPYARSPSALWMVDSLASSLPPPGPNARDGSPGVEPGAAPPAGVSSPPVGHAIEDPVAEMRERASLGDYTGALEMADLILTQDPSNSEAAECVASCRAVLETMYSAKLGPLDRAPIVVTPRAQLRWLSIDHRAGFILSLIDGVSPIEMIIDVSGMPKLDALRILHELVQQRIVSFKA